MAIGLYHQLVWPWTMAINGGFLKWGMTKTIGFNTKIVLFGMIWGYPHDFSETSIYGFDPLIWNWNIYIYIYYTSNIPQCWHIYHTWILWDNSSHQIPRALAEWPSSQVLLRSSPSHVWINLRAIRGRCWGVRDFYLATLWGIFCGVYPLT